MTTVTLILLISNLVVQAQTWEPQCITAAGGTTYSPESGVLLDWNWGEAVGQGYFNSHKYIISAGFLQNKNKDLALFAQLDHFFIHLKYGPNPANNYLAIHWTQAGVQLENIVIINLQGQIVKIIKGPFSTLHFFMQIDVTELSTGLYNLYLTGVIGEAQKFTRCIKLYKI